MKIQTITRSCLAVLFLFVVKGATAAEKITVVFGETWAPWVVASTHQGIIVDMFEAAMTPLGYEIVHVYLPYARRSKAYKSEGVDVVSDMNLNTINKYNLPGFFSDIAYT